MQNKLLSNRVIKSVVIVVIQGVRKVKKNKIEILEKNCHVVGLKSENDIKLFLKFIPYGGH